MALVDVSYCDDTAYVVVGRPKELEAKIGKSTAVIAREFARFGLTLNFAPGKMRRY